MKKANNKKCVAVLSSAALGVLIASALTTSAHAAVNGYVLKDAGDASKVVSFDKTALLKDYENSAIDEPSPMFDAYMKDQGITGNFVAFNDSVKGLVSYDAVMNAYKDALLDGEDFNMDNFTENATGSALDTTDTVGYTAKSDGTLTPVDLSKVVKSVSAITATTNAGTAAALPSTVNVTLGDGTTKAANITWSAAATSAATYANAGTVTVTGTLADYNNTPVTAVVTVNAVASTLSVQSVTQISAAQIKVTFNQQVDQTTAENVTNYVINGKALIAANDKAEMQADKQSVIITFNGTSDAGVLKHTAGTTQVEVLADGLLDNNTAYTFTVKSSNGANTLVNATGDKTLAKDYSGSIFVSDAVKPQVTSAQMTNGNLVIKFNKKVAAGTIPTIKINGIPVAAGITAYASDVTNDGFVVAGSELAKTYLGLTAGNSYSLFVAGATDLYSGAANANTMDIYNTTFNYTVSYTAAQVASVTPISENVFDVKFTQPLSSVPSMSATASTADNLVVRKSGALVNGIISDVSASKYYLPANQVFRVTLASTPDVLFDSSKSETSVPLTVETKGIKDAAGNVIADTTSNLTMTKDTSAPTLVKTSYDGSNNIKVQFNETLDNSASALTAAQANITITDPTGVVVATPAVTMATTTNTNDTLVIPVSGMPTDKLLTLSFAKGAVTDVALDSVNKVAPFATTVTIPAYTVDTTAPSVASVSSSTKDTITVNYTEAATGSGLSTTATDPNNYTIDGKALPAGTVITLNGTTNASSGGVATIKLPTGSFAYDGKVVLTITGIKDNAGNVMPTYTNSAVAVEDSIAPQLLSGVKNADGTITLTFSDNVVLGTSSEADLQVKVNGTGLLTSAYTLSAITGQTKQLKLTPTAGTTFSGTVTVKALQGSTAADINDGASAPNYITAGTSAITVQ